MFKLALPVLVTASAAFAAFTPPMSLDQRDVARQSLSGSATYYGGNVQVARPAKVREPEVSSSCIYASQQGGRQAELATIMFSTGLTMWRACAYLCGQWSCAWLLMQCPFRRLQQSALCKAAPVSAKKHPSSVQALLYSVINTTSCSRSTLMAKVSNGSTAKDVAFKCGWLTGSMWMVASLS